MSGLYTCEERPTSNEVELAEEPACQWCDDEVCGDGTACAEAAYYYWQDSQEDAWRDNKED